MKAAAPTAMSVLTIAQLITLLLTQPEEAGAELYSRVGPWLLRICIGIAGSAQAGEELASYVRVAMWHQVHALRDQTPSGLEGWLYRIVRRCHEEMCRQNRQRAHRELVYTQGNKEGRMYSRADFISPDEVEQRLSQEVFSRFSPQQVFAFDLFRCQYKFNRIAAIIGVAPTTIRNWVHRIQAAVRAAVEEWAAAM